MITISHTHLLLHHTHYHQLLKMKKKENLSNSDIGKDSTDDSDFMNQSTSSTI